MKCDHARERSLDLDARVRIDFYCNDKSLCRHKMDTLRALQGLVKELQFCHGAENPMSLSPLYECAPSVSKVTHILCNADIKARSYLSGMEKVRGLRSLHFEIDEDSGRQPYVLARTLADMLEEHGLMIEVYGLERDSEIVTSATVTNMDHAAQSLYMVPHLLERYGLSVNECFDFFVASVGESLTIKHDQ